MYLSERMHGFTSINCVSCGHQHNIIRRCGFRFCPVCNKDRYGRIFSRMDYILESTDLPVGYNFVHLTLSYQNCIDLKSGVKKLVKSFRKLRSSKLWIDNVVGGFFVIEVKGTTNNYHPHLHIVMASRFIPYDLLLARWRWISGGTGVYLKKISKANAKQYLCKYLLKPSVPDNCQLYVETSLKGLRLFTRFGSFSKIDLSSLRYRFPCPNCNRSEWLSEYEIERSFRALRKYG